MKNQFFLIAIRGMFEAVKGIMRGSACLKGIVVFCMAVCVSASLQAQRATETQKMFAENIHLTDPSIHAELHKTTIDTRNEELQIIVSSNIHKYDRNARSEAYRASVATGNSKVISAANESLDKVNWDGVDRSIKVSPYGNLSATQLFNMANMYESGRGVPRDKKKYCELIREAAEKGHSEAMVGWGHELLFGYNVPRNKEMGLYWLNRALKNENGTLTTNGRGAAQTLIEYER